MMCAGWIRFRASLMATRRISWIDQRINDGGRFGRRIAECNHAGSFSPAGYSEAKLSNKLSFAWFNSAARPRSIPGWRCSRLRNGWGVSVWANTPSALARMGSRGVDHASVLTLDASDRLVLLKED